MKRDGNTKSGRGKRRSTRGLGRLYKRNGGKEYPADNPINAPYWLQYNVPNPTGTGRGQCVRVPLRDAEGRPITDGAQADGERKRIMAPYLTGNAVETLKALQTRLTNANSEHAAAVADANPSIRIPAAWDAYIASPERPDSGEVTLGQYKGHWNRFEKWLSVQHPEIVTLVGVTPGIAIDYAVDLNAAGLSSNRFNKHVGFLKLFFRVLADPGRMTVNPFARIKRRTLRTHSRRELTIPELTTILNIADGDLALLLYLGACTGLRLGDCCTLTWGNVDLARGIIQRIPNKTAKNRKPVTLGIPPALHDRLAAIPPKRRTGFVLPDMAVTYRHDPSSITNRVKAHVLDCGIDVHAPGTGERIKRKEDGTPERAKNTNKVVTETTGKAAVVDVGFHSLRHTWVSMHAARGTPQAIVQASVGHANPSMTAHYTHVSEATARDVALALPAFSVGTTPANRDPLPKWAVALAKTLTPENASEVKAALLRG